MASNPHSSGTQPPMPSIAGSAGPPQNYGPPMHIQFRPAVPTQQAHQFVTSTSQQFRPAGQGMPGSNVGMPGQTHIPHFFQMTQHLPPRPSQPGQVPPSSQTVPLSYIQPNRTIAPGSLQPQQNVQISSNGLPTGLIPAVIHLGVLLRWFSPDISQSEMAHKGDGLRAESGKRITLMIQSSHHS